MGEIINLCNSNQETAPAVMDTDLVEIADGILFDTRANIAHKQVISMPIAELATLGAGVASLNTPGADRQFDRASPTPVPLKPYTLSAGPTPSV